MEEGDLAALDVALRRVGAWPEGFGLEAVESESLLTATALFVKIVRLKGWPRCPTGLMVWAWRNRASGGPEALSEIRKRLGRERPASGLAMALGDAFRVPQEENGVPDLSQMR